MELPDGNGVQKSSFKQAVNFKGCNQLRNTIQQIPTSNKKSFRLVLNVYYHVPTATNISLKESKKGYGKMKLQNLYSKFIAAIVKLSYCFPDLWKSFIISFWAPIQSGLW